MPRVPSLQPFYDPSVSSRLAQGTLRVTLSNPLASGLPVRKYMALDARERAGLKAG